MLKCDLEKLRMQFRNENEIPLVAGCFLVLMSVNVQIDYKKQEQNNS